MPFREDSEALTSPGVVLSADELGAEKIANPLFHFGIGHMRALDVVLNPIVNRSDCFQEHFRSPFRSEVGIIPPGWLPLVGEAERAVRLRTAP